VKNSKGKGKLKPRPKKNSMTKVRTKQTSKASEKRQRESLAVTALENATVAALQVCVIEPFLCQRATQSIADS